MPVVSQSRARAIVPVGASTLACELRTPWLSPSDVASSQERRAAVSRLLGTSASSISSAFSRCMRSTFSIASALSA